MDDDGFYRELGYSREWIDWYFTLCREWNPNKPLTRARERELFLMRQSESCDA